MSYWILLAVIVAVLYVYWRLMAFTFNLIDRRHEMLRAEARESGSKPVRGKVI